MMIKTLPAAFATALMMMFSFATTVMAQGPIDQAQPDNAWKTPAAAILLGGFIIAASIKKSKREHRE